MQSSTTVLIVFGALLGAVLLDLLLLRSLRRRLRERGLGDRRAPGVYVLGAYSPLLTLARYGRLIPDAEALSPSEVEMPGRRGARPGRSLPEPVLRGAVELGWRGALLEAAVILTAVLLYSSAFLDFDPVTVLPGLETGIFQALDWVFYNAIRLQGSFPLWNKFLHTGLPYIADPNLHVFNPLVALPVLVLGVQSGFKLAVAASLALGALGMWRLCLSLGMQRPVRVWVALMFAFAGQPAARFFQGQYLFVFAFAWLPWTMSGLFRLAQTRQRRYIALTALGLALTYFSGGAYDAFYLLLFGLIFALVMLPSLGSVRRFSFDRQLAAGLGVTLLLALALSAVQLLPWLELWPRMEKASELVGVQSLRQVFLDYLSKDTFRPDAFELLPARQEFYAYIGWLPFAALALLPLAFCRRERRPLVVFILLVFLVVLWITLDLSPWPAALPDVRLALQFQHLLRILIFGSLGLLLLAGLGLDTAWQALQRVELPESASPQLRLKGYAAAAGLILIGAGMLYSVADLYTAHRSYIQPAPASRGAFSAAAWLRQYDLSEYYVRLNPNNLGHDAVAAAGLRFLDVWYYLGDLRSRQGSLTPRPVEARPHYVIQYVGQTPPERAAGAAIQTIEDYAVYAMQGSLPLAFTLAEARLSQDGPLEPSEVTPQTLFSPGPNRMEVIASSPGGEFLVALVTHYPGWQVRVDGQLTRLENIGGYLAVRAAPGVHRYEFAFRPALFYAGLVSSLAALGLCLAILARDLRRGWLGALAGLKALPSELGAVRRRLLDRAYAGRLIAAAQYEAGVLRPAQELDLPPGDPVTVEVFPAGAGALPSAWLRWRWAGLDLARALLASLSLGGLLFVFGLALYLFTRLYALESFPIYFFGDEAVQALFAEDLIARKFHGVDGNLLPMYVEAAGQRWTPLISMYVHALTLSLFGKSIFVTRATSAIVSLLGPAAVGLTLRRVFKARFWWAGVLLAGLAPAWFLHSRTAFETVMTTAFYACFLYFYLLYRTESPRYLYAAIVFGAATFYSYSNAQVILAAAAGLLFLSDLRYHLKHPDILLRGLALVALLAIPLVSFRLSRPAAIDEHLRMVASYWYQAIPLSQKLALFAQKYLYGLSPQYWFFSNTQDLERHRMAGMGHILTAVLPLFLIGLAVCLWKVRSSPHRAVILAALATPVGAALLEIGIARVLAFIMPASILAGLGLDWLLERVRRRLPQRTLAWGIFAVLAIANLLLLRTALLNGPLWFRHYGLYGMQYGARQLFEQAIPQYLAKHPDANLLIASSWANGPDNFIRFFIPEEQRSQVRMESVDTYLFRRTPLSGNEVFVATPAEFQRAQASPKFTGVRQELVIPYPDGTPGFYFVRLSYSDAADAIFAAEAEARKQLIEDRLVLEGQTVRLRHSQIDMGKPALMFDGNLFTLMRGLEANPFVLELYFPQPVQIGELQADFGMMNAALKLTLHPPGDAPPREYSAWFGKEDGDPSVVMPLDPAFGPVAWLRLEILDSDNGETANVHIRELHFLP